MGEVIIRVAIWSIKASFFTALVLSFLAMLAIITSYLIVGFNLGVISDIYAIIQLWLPFNLNIIFVWITIAATAYFSYRLAFTANQLLNNYIN